MLGCTLRADRHAGFIYCVLARVGYGLARCASTGVSGGDQCQFARWASEPETARRWAERRTGERFVSA